MEQRAFTALSLCRLFLKKFWPAGLALALTCAVYSPILKHGFVWDDYFVVVNNAFVKSLKNIPLVFTKDYLTRAGDMGLVGVKVIGSGESTYRPMVTLSYFFDHAVFGLRPAGYHAHNLFLHLLNTLLVYLLIAALAGNVAAACLGALLFGLHPVNTEAVCGIANREDLQVSLFYILSFLCYVKSGVAWDKRAKPLIAVSLLSFFLALFSKEMAVTLPFIILAYDSLYRAPGGWGAIRGRKNFYLGYLAILVFYLIVRFGVLVIDSGQQGPWLGGGLYPHVCTMLRVVFTYSRWLLFPLGLHHMIPEDSALISRSLLEGGVAVSLLTLAGLLAIAVIFRRSCRALSFGLLWFFVTLVPVMNIMPLQNFMGLRFLYIPAFGLCFIGGFFLSNLLKRPGYAVRVFAGILAAAVLIFYAAVTSDRIKVWKDDLAFSEDLVRNYPLVPRVRCILGIYFQERHQSGKALEEFEKTIELDPRYGKAYLGLGIFYQEQGLIAGAIKNFEQAVALDKRLWQAHYYLGNIFLKEGMYPRAIEHYNKLLQMAPRNTAAYNNLGVIYLNTGSMDKAREIWRKALAIDPEDTFALERLKELPEKERNAR